MSTPPNQNPGQPQWGGPRPGQPFGQPAGGPGPHGQPSANPPHGQSSANPPAGYGPAGHGANQVPAYGAPAAQNYTAQGFNTTPNPNAGRNKKILLIIAGVLVAIVVALAALGAWSSSQNRKNSEAAVSDLLSALKAGDATTALSLLSTTSSHDPAAEPLLTDAAIADNAANFDYSPEFVNVDASSTAQTYNVTIRVNGVDKVVQWDVLKNSDRWQIEAADVLTEIALDPEMPHVINGLQIPAQTSEVLALPGSYAVTSGLSLLNYDPAAATIDLHTGGRASFASQLQVADGVLEAVQAQVRDQLNACVAERAQPTVCDWPLTFTNGEAVNGTISWVLEPGDPAASLTMPTDWRASTGYVSTVMISYRTIASGEGALWEGGTGVFDNEINSRNNAVRIDLSGEAPVVTIS